MMTLAATLIIFGTMALVEEGTETDILKYLASLWSERVTDQKNETRTCWDNVQVHYDCCGLDSTSNYISTGASGFPKSCCAIDAQMCTSENAYKIYCFDAVKKYYTDILLFTLVIVAFAMSIVCIVLIISAWASFLICGLPSISSSNLVL